MHPFLSRVHVLKYVCIINAAKTGKDASAEHLNCAMQEIVHRKRVCTFASEMFPRIKFRGRRYAAWFEKWACRVSSRKWEKSAETRGERQVGNGERSMKGRKGRCGITLWKERDGEIALGSSYFWNFRRETRFRFVSKNVTQLNRLEKRN